MKKRESGDHFEGSDALALFRAAFDAAPDGVFIADDGGCYVEVNAALCALLGAPRDELLGQRIGAFAKGIAFEDHWKPFLEAGVARLEFNLASADGTRHLVELIGRANVLPGRHMAIVRDVTARRKSDEALRESEELLEQAQEVAHVGSWIYEGGADTDRDSPEPRRIWSKEMYKILGLTEAGIPRHEDYVDRVHPEDIERVEKLRETVGSPEMEHALDHRIIRPDGTVRWVHVQADVFRGAPGRPHRLVGTMQDITEQRHLEEQLRQSQKMEAIGRLAGGIAHDFNNLLTAILGYSDLLEARLGGNEDSLADLAEIRRAGERAAALTRQLLAFSRKQVLQPRILDLNEIVHGMERMLSRLIGEDLRLTMSLGPDIRSIRADAGQVEQVILNLAVNARDAMPDGGTLRLETANVPAGDPSAPPPGPWVGLTISDTGVGMDAATMSQIFQPFFTTKDPGKGTGLGLATAYGIVQQSGGHITVESELRRGTTFRILFPLAVGTPDVLPHDERKRQAAAAARRVLLVEDDDAVRRLARATLETRGWVVLEAASAEEALVAADGRIATLDLVVSDVVMSGMNGNEMARRLRAARPDLPVLLMSGYTSDPTFQDGGLSGTAFLQKPFTPNGLLEKVNEALRGPNERPVKRQG